MNSMHILRGWAARQTPWLGLAAAFAVAQPALAADYTDSPQVSEFIVEMNRDYGFAAEQLGRLFAAVERKQSIIDAISRPAEKVKPWKDYRPIFITDSRIARGVDFWREHEATLAMRESVMKI